MADRDLVRGAIKMLYGLKPDRSSHVRSTIHEAGQGNNRVKMQYVPAYDNKPRTYVVDPYEFKGKYFYAFHPRHNQIHSFLRSRIISVTPTKAEFDPQWPVKV